MRGLRYWIAIGIVNLVSYIYPGNACDIYVSTVVFTAVNIALFIMGMW
jgi:hypothetical protein